MYYIEALSFAITAILKGSGVLIALQMADTLVKLASQHGGVYLLCYLLALYLFLLAVLCLYECWQEFAVIARDFQEDLFGDDED